MAPVMQVDSDFDEAAPAAMMGAMSATQAGRFEGSVKRESDGATFLRAIELGTPSDGSQSIRCYEQLGGSIPTTPQHSGTATVLGPFVIFSASDSVANRKYLSVVLRNFMISTSTSTYHDGRPDVRLAGLLKKV